MKENCLCDVFVRGKLVAGRIVQVARTLGIVVKALQTKVGEGVATTSPPCPFLFTPFALG